MFSCSLTTRNAVSVEVMYDILVSKDMATYRTYDGKQVESRYRLTQTYLAYLSLGCFGPIWCHLANTPVSVVGDIVPSGPPFFDGRSRPTSASVAVRR